MSSGRKRKFGTVIEPSEDKINEGIKLRRILAEFRVSNLFKTTKVINDPVHGHFELPSLLFKIIDTPQFQRLRHIKQLGGCYLVFPGASHNRFEHSLGVAFLAGKLCRTLRKQQPELNITAIDILCVQIAGLCHDLGHGPFSHTFDGLFLPTVKPGSNNWSHERGSVEMFNHLKDANNLHSIFEEHGFTSDDMRFIQELIVGPSYSTKEWPYVGREKEKCFLYEIVANKRTGIDVDKWDYFARDCYHLGISNNFDYKRYMKFARVVSVDGKLQICTRDKEVGTLYDMFHTRNSLHRRAYQHKTCKIIDFMISDALVKANPYFKLPGCDGRSISECIEDMDSFTKLTDDVLTLIRLSEDENLQPSRDIIDRLLKRDLYKFVGQKLMSPIQPKGEAVTFQREIYSVIRRDYPDLVVSEDDIVVHLIRFDYGLNEQNPMDFVRFYHKSNPVVARKMEKNQVSQMLPEVFAEQHLRCYYKRSRDHDLESIQKSFLKWCGGECAA